MSLPVVGNRHFSVSASRVILQQLLLRRRKETTIHPVKKNCKSHRFLDLCSMSIRIRGKRKKRKTKGISGNKIGRRRGQPRKIRNPSDVVDSEVPVDKSCSDLGTKSKFDDSGIKRKRGRPRKSGDGFNEQIVNCKSENKEEIMNLDNREGTMVDLSALANYEDDPYGEELRRITLELKTEEEFLGFLEQLNGEWVNVGKKKKVGNACDYGGYLPKGWKLMLCIKQKGSNLWLACRKYVSPGGREFETCKEVSAYLQSLVDSQSKNQLNALQSDKKTPGQAVMMANESLVGNPDLPDLNAETNKNRESKRTNNEVFEEAENGDIIEPVKSSLVEKDDKTAESLNGVKKDDMKKRDDNMENLVVPANSQARSEEFIKDLPWTTEEIQRIWGSRNP